jgi:hypothetical protein
MAASAVRPVTRSLNPVSHKRSRSHASYCLSVRRPARARRPLLRRHPLGAGHEANEVTKLPARLPGTSAVTHHPLVVHRYIQRASIHRDGGPKTALTVTNTAARASRDSRTTSAIFDRFCFVIMFAPPTRGMLALTIVDQCACACAISHRALTSESPRRVDPSAALGQKRRGPPARVRSPRPL